MSFRTDARRATIEHARRFSRIAYLFLFFLCCAAQNAPQKTENVPNFSAMTNTSERKQAFFCYMAPLVENENARVTEDRMRIVRIQKNQTEGRAIDESGRRFVKKVASKYKMRSDDVDTGLLEALLLHVDKVPVSLALAQAANESAWGTSRFAKEGNNYFGQWCFRKGCGIVPRERPSGAIYEVRNFTGTQQSVAAFIANLNTNAAYASFRTIRFQERSQGIAPSGLATAEGLEKYSARGIEYVKTLQSMIRYNRLKAFDMPNGTESTCRDNRARATERAETAKTPA